LLKICCSLFQCFLLQDLSIDESYDALSQKTASFHRWAAENVSFMFAFKTDDDIFVRIDRLVLALYQVGSPRILCTDLCKRTPHNVRLYVVLTEDPLEAFPVAFCLYSSVTFANMLCLTQISLISYNDRF
jgi:hypothetical protein